MVHCSNRAANLTSVTRRKYVEAGLSSWHARPRGGTYITWAIAATTASMFFGFSAATQMRPESTP
jgi:hypothetical protein